MCLYAPACPEEGFEVDRNFGMDRRRPAWPSACKEEGHGSYSPGLRQPASKLIVTGAWPGGKSLRPASGREAKRTLTALPPGRKTGGSRGDGKPCTTAPA